MLSVQGAVVRFGDEVALDHLDLDVKPNERLVVLGPSGSGKSTLLRAIAGLQDLEDGVVLMRGDDMADVPIHRRGIGLMFQDGLLFPHLSVGDNIAYGLVMRGVPRRDRERRVDELLDLVGLSPAISHDRGVTDLSGGEQQRVALARSLAPSPDLLLLDEPFASLDAVLRGRLADDVRALTEALGMTVIAVTHDRAEAFAFADRIAVMDNGRVVQCATPEELWAQPESELVARLVGMSVVDRAALGGAGVTVALGGQQVAVRPAGVSVVAAEDTGLPSDPGTYGGEGVVEARSASGDSVRLTVLLDGAAPARLRQLHVDVPPDAALVRGARVRVMVAPDAVVRVTGVAG